MEIRDPLLRETLEIFQGLARRARSTTPTVLLAEAIEEMRVRPVLRQRGGRAAERALANVDAFLDVRQGPLSGTAAALAKHRADAHFLDGFSQKHGRRG